MNTPTPQITSRLSYRSSAERDTGTVFGRRGHGMAITAGRCSCSTSSTTTVLPV
jgi:hypothetical protein